MGIKTTKSKKIKLKKDLNKVKTKYENQILKKCAYADLIIIKQKRKTKANKVNRFALFLRINAKSNYKN